MYTSLVGSLRPPHRPRPTGRRAVCSKGLAIYAGKNIWLYRSFSLRTLMRSNSQASLAPTIASDSRNGKCGVRKRYDTIDFTQTDPDDGLWESNVFEDDADLIV